VGVEKHDERVLAAASAGGSNGPTAKTISVLLGTPPGTFLAGLSLAGEAPNPEAGGPRSFLLPAVSATHLAFTADPHVLRASDASASVPNATTLVASSCENISQ
jgi:hypothetical protein